MKLLRRILGAPIGMKDNGLWTCFLSHSHQHGLEDQVTGELGLHRPADDWPRKHIQHDRQVESTFLCRNR